MMNSSESGDTKTSAPWLRVSLVSVCYFAIKSASHLVNLWPLIIALWASGERFQQFFWQFGLPALVVVYFTSLWMQYWFFRYREEDSCIHIRSGLFNRRRLTLYFDRVQQADIIQPFYFRPFGLATLGLESAGSAQQEVDIPGIPYAVAERLKKNILLQRKKMKTGESSPEGDGVGEQEASYQLHLPPMEIARYGLMYNGLLFLLPIFGLLSQQSGNFMETVLSSISDSWLVTAFMDITQYSQSWLIALAAGISVLMGAAVLFSLSAMIAVFRFWDYSLVQRGDQFQYRAGLATIRSRGFRLHKLQKITINQGMIARLLKRYTVIISKTGGGVAQPGQELQGEAKKFIIPVLTEQDLQDFLRQVQCNSQINHWHPISPLYIVWWSGWWGFFITGTALIVVLIEGLPLWPLLLVQGTLIAVFWRRWKCYGFFLDQDWLAIRTGFIGKKIVVVPNVKTQKISLYQPPWLRYKSLANFCLWSGGGEVSVPFLPRPLAATTRAQIMKQVITYRGRWF